jgi:hypothetical protein
LKSTVDVYVYGRGVTDTGINKLKELAPNITIGR